MVRKKTSKIVPVLALVAITIIGVGFFGYKAKNHKTTMVETRETTQQVVPKENVSELDQGKKAVVADTAPIAKTEVSTIWPVQFTNEESSSLQVVVNKKHKLPPDYVPSLQQVEGGQMRPEAASALEDLYAKAKNDEIPLKIISSYRSYSQQVSVYNGYAAQYGADKADTFSARPGHSEHQTGLAVDLGASSGQCDLEICFETTATGDWIKNNSYIYGFIIRYPKDKETLTGYQFEPWHLRYVGKDIASKLHTSGQTLDQYYAIEAGGY
jgi:D-alanyl-D-alanine carboxypeptidase